MTIDPRTYGAKADGTTNDAAAIQQAIDACEVNGGGTVRLTDGAFLSGTLFLKSNVYLNVAASARLVASPNIADYSPNVHHNRYRNETNIDRCFIYAEDAHDFGLIGHGMIEGQAEAFPNEGSIYRPMMIRVLRCSNVHIENLRLYNAAAWTTAFLDSEYIWVRGVDIKNDKHYNGDGLDFDGCAHVFVSDCYVRGTDDNFCLQASSKALPVHDVHVTNCEFSGICAGIRIGLKSIGDIRSVTISNCTFDRVWREGIKIESTEGGTISDISVSNIVMRNVTRPIFVILNNRFEPDEFGTSIELNHVPAIGHLENVDISHLTAVDDEEMANTHMRFTDDVMGSPRFNGIRFDAADGHSISGVTLSDIRYTFIGGVTKADIPSDDEYPKVLDRLVAPHGKSSENYYPDWSRTSFMDLRNVADLQLRNIRLKTLRDDERPAILTDGCDDMVADNIRVNGKAWA
ncbi:glycoside hydrolase family 28 protein [Bifidobacterium vansinderenii]|uniref:Polygalacturonase n=1 Tax=Bifidobacterium vansinderenii TaxID=1984871 RepID=A0A229VZ02_9BIFI|nr:glycosyl hydrolase family 28 protein [Bifidobacterium vansinderenii]OXN00853.1 polygalacturonase [Bifidobacterium vansinderenii]